MSYGSLGKNAITALNLGAKLAGCYHNTGEVAFRLTTKGRTLLALGTGYFGARDENGRFSLEK